MSSSDFAKLPVGLPPRSSDGLFEPGTCRAPFSTFASRNVPATTIATASGEEHRDTRMSEGDMCAQAILERNLELTEENRELKIKVKRLTHLVYIDTQTGLTNRRYFEIALDAEIRRAVRNGTALTLLICDLDHFKRINDEFGHQYGDAVLARVAGAIAQRCRRAGDVAARYGGEEFALILPAVDWSEMILTVEGLRKSVAALAFERLGRAGHGPVTMSIGVTTFHDSKVCPAADVLYAADTALYEAKRSGRNRAKYRAVGHKAQPRPHPTGPTASAKSSGRKASRDSRAQTSTR